MAVAVTVAVAVVVAVTVAVTVAVAVVVVVVMAHGEKKEDIDSQPSRSEDEHHSAATHAPHALPLMNCAHTQGFSTHALMHVTHPTCWFQQAMPAHQGNVHKIFTSDAIQPCSILACGPGGC